MSDILKVRDDSGEWREIPAITGLSAYQIAVKNGFVGTEEDWLESLKGEQGNPGTGGSTGPQGPAGPGVPPGGTASQVLVKKTDTAYDAQWVDAVLMARKLFTERQIDGMPFDGSKNITHFAVCRTAADVAEKTVTLNGFKQVSGARIAVQFLYVNTAQNPTLSVNDGTPMSICYKREDNFIVSAEALSGVVELICSPNVWFMTTSYNAYAANKLLNVRTFQTNLSKISAASFDGSANCTPGVTGTLPISNGGTGATTAAEACENIGARPATWTPTAKDVGALPTSGGTMTGTITANPSTLSDTYPLIHAGGATDIKLYKDEGGNANMRFGNSPSAPAVGKEVKVIGVADPTVDSGAANKRYVDSAVSGITSGVTSFNGRTGAVTPQSGDYTAAQVGALPIGGGTLTGDLRIKGSGNFGTKINLGDSDYVHIAEPTDDCLEIKAKKINFVVSATSDDKFTLNGDPIGSGGTPSSFPASGLTGTVAIANGGSGATTAAAALYAFVNGSTALTSSGIADGDYIAICDVSAATGKKITVANLRTALGSSGGSGGGVAVGTYTGNNYVSKADTLQSMQAINLGFQPSFVFVGKISDTTMEIPWYYFESSSEMEWQMSAGYAKNGVPLVGWCAKTRCNVLEITATGFSVRNAKGTGNTTTTGYTKTYRAELNENGDTYVYFAFK